MMKRSRMTWALAPLALLALHATTGRADTVQAGVACYLIEAAHPCMEPDSGIPEEACVRAVIQSAARGLWALGLAVDPDYGVPMGEDGSARTLVLQACARGILDADQLAAAAARLEGQGLRKPVFWSSSPVEPAPSVGGGK
jgi:hypothetical protein